MGPTPDWSDLPYVQMVFEPEVTRPVVIAAFEGWNDAGDAATTAARFLSSSWNCETVAEIDPEEFFDFTTSRPTIRLTDEGRRILIWPWNRINAGPTDDPDLDVAIVIGVEPQLRWRTFCEQIVGVATSLDARMVVSLGALLAEVPHSRPTRVFGTADDEALAARLDLEPSRYEGPTGIVGTLHAACRDAGLPSVSLWAAVPSYVPAAPSPKAAVALIDRLSLLLDVTIHPSYLSVSAEDYVRQVSELVAEDDETLAYVESLEQRYDEEGHLPSADALAAEVERYLRDH